MTQNDEERLIESLKLEFEMHKHFTTVIAALAVVLLTMLQGFFEHRPYTRLEYFFLIFCFVILGVGGLWATLAMQRLFKHVRHPDGVDIENRKHWVALVIPGVTLAVGILLFCAFVYFYMQRVHGDAALTRCSDGGLHSGGFRECDFL